MISIKDKEAWILEREEEFSENLYGVAFSALGKTLQMLVYRWAERDYNDTLADYAESRCAEWDFARDKYGTEGVEENDR